MPENYYCGVNNTVYSCTCNSYYSISSGTCTGIVVNTGDRTVMGRIARLTGSIQQEREIQ